MEVIIQETAEKATGVAARIVAALLREKPDAVLGLATGNTPTALYEQLVRLHRDEGLGFEAASSFNLDEFVGVPEAHRASYHHYMRRHLFDHVDVRDENVHLLDGNAEDIPGECDRYEEDIRDVGGIDLQILGIGPEGHIGFNEPTSSLGSRTRIKTLTRRTRRDLAGAFDEQDDVPKHVLTMGIQTILETRTCLLLAFGVRKARAVAAMIEGPVSASVPASGLQLHEDARVILDEAAASELERKSYYREVYEAKPSWQR